MINTDYINELRRFEMDTLSSFIPQGSKVLEFGSGTGEQAKYLTELGYDVVAIDLPSSDYAAHRVFPVQDYDGRKIPLDDNSVDVIFSSNVMEHVENLAEILGEHRRVLRPGGMAIHAVPTSLWRFWTCASGPLASVRAIGHLIGYPRAPLGPHSPPQSPFQHFKAIVGPILPLGHGTSPEGISELWTFSAIAWRRSFRRNGWEVQHQQPLGMFYTGNAIFGRKIPFSRREKLSEFLGSAVNLFVLRPT